MVKKLMIGTLITIFLLNMAACGQLKDESENIKDMIVGKTYLYEKGGFGGSFTIQFNEDGTFVYYEGILSSYLGIGDWALDQDILILSDDAEFEYSLVNRFKVENDTLVFLSEHSSNFIYVKVADGERFTITSGEAFPKNIYNK